MILYLLLICGAMPSADLPHGPYQRGWLGQKEKGLTLLASRNHLRFGAVKKQRG